MAPDYPRPWRHIADDLRDKILAGRWQPGDRLPTVAELGRQYGRAGNTIRNAVNQLVEEGLLSTRTGSGIYVTEQARREAGGDDDRASSGP